MFRCLLKYGSEDSFPQPKRFTEKIKSDILANILKQV